MNVSEQRSTPRITLPASHGDCTRVRVLALPCNDTARRMRRRCVGECPSHRFRPLFDSCPSQMGGDKGGEDQEQVERKRDTFKPETDTMAEFCWECTESVMGMPGHMNDFQSPDNPETYRELCEGCGWGLFDFHGRRVDDDQKGDDSP